MMRTWMFRIVLILSPFIVLLIFITIAEIGLRFYSSAYGPVQISRVGPPPFPVADGVLTHDYDLPTNVAKKAKFRGVWLQYSVDLLDNDRHRMISTVQNQTYALPRNSSQQLVRRVIKTGEVIYNINMQSDEFGRRITPQPEAKKTNRHLVFLGCSYTIGEGVEQDETLPYYTANATENYKAYNLGYHGATISDTWVFLNKMDMLQDVSEKKGYAIYVFLDDHIPRYQGSLRYLGHWIYGRPYVRPDHNGQATYLGMWKNAKPLTVFVAQLLAQSTLLKTLQFNLPPVRQRDLEEFVQVVASVRQEYWNKLGSENPFVFVFYFEKAKHYSAALKPLLEKAKIPYLDYSDFKLEQLSNSRVRIPVDGHPNALAHKLVGELIAEDLNLNQ